MIRDLLNVCVALVLSARARQIFRRILARHRGVSALIGLTVEAALVVFLLLVFPFRHEGAPARHEVLEFRDNRAEMTVTNNVVYGGDTTTTLPVLNGETRWTTSSNWTTSAPLNITNGGTGAVMAYRTCTINGAPPAWTNASGVSGATVAAETLPGTDVTCYVQR